MTTLFDPVPFDPPLSPATDGTRPGCRLVRFELYNWGTFNERAWVFELDGRNTLLTGDIGSGKSTIVDGITTLLLPAHRISYNKAAGADTRERDLRSYVLGHYKSERVETTGTTRPVGLRGPQHYSVLLGVFTHDARGDTTTVAQVFRAREDQSQPERFYVVADCDLTIADHFSEVGDTLQQLRQRLKELGARIYDHFPDYGRDVRRRLGIESDQALDLFHQTVSMKAVDNLNEFVRSHMLEPFDMSERIQSLIGHFDDLTRAHDAVVRARDQLELLAPLMEQLAENDGLSQRLDTLDRIDGMVPVYFARRRRELLTGRLVELDTTIAELSDQVHRYDADLDALRDRSQQLAIDIANKGGNRLAEINREIDGLTERWPKRKAALGDLNRRLQQVGLDKVTHADQFRSVHEHAAVRTSQLEAEQNDVHRDHGDRSHEWRLRATEIDEVRAELRSLQARRSNLPRASLDLRDQLVTALGISSDELPFVGELLQVRSEATEWEGATERVLRNFALSLLVPDQHYERVATWINSRHLGTRLVYYRVPPRLVPARAPDRSAGFPLLVDFVEIQPGSEFEPWLRNELSHRADHACVESVHDFRRADKAVTREGQVKSRDRHEKDDRRRVDDRREYVLGWSNERKIEALLEHARSLHESGAPLREAIAQLEARRNELAEQLTQLAVIAERDDWSAFDWEGDIGRIADLEAEAERITSDSDVLRALTAEQTHVTSEITRTEDLVRARRDELGGARSERRQVEHRIDDLSKVLADDADVDSEIASEIARLVPAELAAELSGVDEIERNVAQHFHGERVDVLDRRGKCAQRIVRHMSAFRSRYPRDVAELDDSVESGPEYRELHDRVAHDDLPRFEDEFRRSLRENTIHEIAGLAAQLNRDSQTIRERIARINTSLQSIDYNPERYIVLVPEKTPNTEIRAFQEDLRAVTTNIVGNDDQYSEQRFLQVKEIIDRFKGREGSTDQDRAWTRRVTDVRQWFTFSASERWRADDAEHESYTDSDGKSGGQKEKLAYTILAASLAYQYRLDTTDPRKAGFRFVVIDEAFGRGSDDSTRYALKLFTRLGLQLLIVTPLQKIHVIEPHVECLGFVDNLNDSYSRLQRVTIQELRESRQTNGDSPAGRVR
jgi:uncharacterized protein YPO0396